MPKRRVKFQMKMEAVGNSVEDLRNALGTISSRMEAGHLIGSDVLFDGNYAFAITEVSVGRKKEKTG